MSQTIQPDTICLCPQDAPRYKISILIHPVLHPHAEELLACLGRGPVVHFFVAYTMVVNCHCYHPILRIHCLFLSNFENQLAMCLLVSECFCRNMEMLLPEHPKVVFFGTWLI